jgi:hypothetical protein
MILSERELQALLDDGAVLIDPRPPADSEQWSSTAVDLTLDSVVLEWTPKVPKTGGGIAPIVPHSKDFDVQGMMEDAALATKVAIHPNDGYILQPRSFVLGFTREKVRIPALDVSRERAGAATRVPLAQAAEGCYDDAGKTLYFTRLAFQGSHTKRYKGGTAQNIWKFAAGDDEAVPLTASYMGTSRSPLWW